MEVRQIGGLNRGGEKVGQGKHQSGGMALETVTCDPEGRHCTQRDDHCLKQQQCPRILENQVKQRNGHEERLDVISQQVVHVPEFCQGDVQIEVGVHISCKSVRPPMPCVPHSIVCIAQIQGIRAKGAMAL